MGRSLVKKVSTCGPPGTSMHSVSRLPTSVGRISTRTVGGSFFSSMAVRAEAGYCISVMSFSAEPGYPARTRAIGNLLCAYSGWKYCGGR